MKLISSSEQVRSLNCYQLDWSDCSRPNGAIPLYGTARSTTCGKLASHTAEPTLRCAILTTPTARRTRSHRLQLAWTLCCHLRRPCKSTYLVARYPSAQLPFSLLDRRLAVWVAFFGVKSSKPRSSIGPGMIVQAQACCRVSPHAPLARPVQESA